MRDQCSTFCLPICTFLPNTVENKLKTVFLLAVPNIVKLYIFLSKNRNKGLVKRVDQRWKKRVVRGWGVGVGDTGSSRVGSELDSHRDWANFLN